MCHNMHRPWVPRKIAYIALAALYASACFGVDKLIVYALVATIYVILSTG